MNDHDRIVATNALHHFLDHRAPSSHVGAARYQEYFDQAAADPHPWSIDGMLPTYVLADRAIPRYPSGILHWPTNPYLYVDQVMAVRITPPPIEELLGLIPLPSTSSWTLSDLARIRQDQADLRTATQRLQVTTTDRPPHPVPRVDRQGTICEDYETDGCSVPFCPTGCYLAIPDPIPERVHTCDLPRPHADLYARSEWLLLLLSLMAVGAVTAWIILGATR